MLSKQVLPHRFGQGRVVFYFKLSSAVALQSPHLAVSSLLKAQGPYGSPGLRDYLPTAAALEGPGLPDWWLDFASAHHPYTLAADHPAGCRLSSCSSRAKWRRMPHRQRTSSTP